jgi:RNA recognition motif-containing protein
MVSGFSRFSSRKDFDLAIGDEIAPESIDIIIDKGSYPVGSWIFQINDKDSSILKNRIKNYKNINLNYSVINPDDIKLLSTARNYGITSSTVRLRNLPNEIGAEEIKYFFQDYALRKNPFLIRNHLTGDFHEDLSFIHFSNSQEALRAVIQKNFKMILGRNIYLLPYEI